jgi:hypothetical protein
MLAAQGKLGFKQEVDAACADTIDGIIGGPPIDTGGFGA